ncbi:hypothetical protein VaNZ11_016716 [Volvox africanus]|uniref:Uncharacterized protein n=1 Tax=Volvox africanus TaxID=51714 RepID=A0ABQ5SNI3_9CHLO|nr:hypothetical protein VaNZ11_016716 [Volvox africanus]
MLALTLVFSVLPLVASIEIPPVFGRNDNIQLLPASGGLQPGAVIHTTPRILQGGVADCVWDGAQCNLRRDFVCDLPGILGSPTTGWAKILADAARRGAVCSNFKGQPDCLLAAPSLDCDWDLVLNRCTLADILDVTALRGVAYFPGSSLDTAMSCFSLGPSACSSSASCILVNASQLGTSSVARGLANLGDLRLSVVMDSMLGTMVKYGIAGLQDSIRTVITSLLGAASEVPDSGQQVCVSRWMLDTASMTSLAEAVADAIGRNQDLLTALVSSTSLTGSYNGTSLPLLVTVRECIAAASASTCAAAASGRCQWLTSIGACNIRENLLPSIALDPSDRWVAVFNNATALCRSITNASLCAAAIDIVAGVQGGGPSGGSGTTAVTITWCLLAAATAIAAALSHLVREI